ncbi:MAG: hypothetical protein P4L82_07190 [Ancalomicrobiaceae bacterium]|nr:hypothetical protein [Ancalomicrobiaceae bacterium]
MALRDGTVFGARVTGNEVKNAMVGINIDGVSGEIVVDGNRVLLSGGIHAACGGGNWQPLNIAPAARRFVQGRDVAMAGSRNSAGCLLNRPH